MIKFELPYSKRFTSTYFQSYSLLLDAYTRLMKHVMSVREDKLKANALRMFLIKQFTNTCARRSIKISRSYGEINSLAVISLYNSFMFCSGDRSSRVSLIATFHIPWRPEIIVDMKFSSVAWGSGSSKIKIKKPKLKTA